MTTQQIEAKALELFPRMNCIVTGEDKMIGWRGRAIDLANWLLSQLPPAQRWVKASERNPTTRDIYFTREYNRRHGIEDGIFKDTRIFDPTDGWAIDSFKHSDIEYVVLEWLDESAPSMDRIVREHGEMKQALIDILSVCDNANPSSFNQIKEAIQESIEIANNILNKIESNGK